MTMVLNQPVEDFSFTTTETDKPVSFSDFAGKNIVLYFYPKDNTPGCTIESKDFRDFHDEFLALDTVVLGVSRDNLKSHHKFKTDCDLPFPLITDAEETLCRYFDVLKEKSMFGKKSIGVVRSTFLIDKKGIVRKEWRNVNVIGHVVEVLQAVKDL
ncbi:MAG: Thiol peroxidase, Bcp-type [Gammaproteobacteria bacterium]|nr:Thiol peroxidase, Bcp-type [Gammaproteobacteria bacterium]